MELLERINALEKEMKMIKGEVRKVLVDLRESMNLLENPFANLEHLRAVSGSGGASIDEERLRYLENTVEQLKKMLLEDGRLEQIENEIKQLKECGVGDAERMRRIDDIEREIGDLRGMIERMERAEERGDTSFALNEIERMKDEFEQLKSLLEDDLSGKIKCMEDEIALLKERFEPKATNAADAAMPRNESVDERMMRADEEQSFTVADDVRAAAEGAAPSALHDEMRDHITDASDGAVGAGMPTPSAIGDEMREIPEMSKSRTAEKEMMDILTLSRLMQWADRTMNMIGREKMLQILDLYEMSGHLSEDEKRIILKITDIPDVPHEREHVETKFCILAMYDLDRILTGRHQELFTLLKELF